MIYPLESLTPGMSPRAGGKAVNLAYLISKGYNVPRGVCITVDAYEDFMQRQGLADQVEMELARRDPTGMRWEELWDASLRIRSLFNKVDLPCDLEREMTEKLQSMVKEPVVIRSSAPGEDGGDSSFAGLHESFVNVHGIERIIEHVKLVWASLWSDRALMYRKELGLDPASSRMAVIVQELLTGKVSGVGFSKSPADASHAVIEAVRGLNKGLVDGDVSPEQWEVSRTTGSIVQYHAGDAVMTITDPNGGTMVQNDRTHGTAALEENEVPNIYNVLMKLESLLGYPVDVEWTMLDGKLYLLQVRPVTALENDRGAGNPWEKEDKRGWYKSLARSFKSLMDLRKRIENQLIPEMKEVAVTLADINPAELDDPMLADEIRRRQDIYLEWRDVYWADFIPFAHGVRLFGRVYNDMLRPDDAYSFTRLLTSDGMISVERNSALEKLANRVRENPADKVALENGDFEKLQPSLLEKIDDFIITYSDTLFQGQRLFDNRTDLVRFLLSMVNAGRNAKIHGTGASRAQLEKEYYDAFPEDKKEFAEQLLALARASWRVRDNDNLYLGGIEAQLLYAVEEGRRRLVGRRESMRDDYEPDEIVFLLRGETPASRRSKNAPVDEPRQKDTTGGPNIPGPDLRDGKYNMRMRQFTGQPAGPGIGEGPARVISGNDDLFNFLEGEVIICDAIDPAMTFVVPLASGIVERRGGMLIHGAIIAREYGIPCVTGIENATRTVRNGDHVTVDGYLGIVTVRDL